MIRLKISVIKEEEGDSYPPVTIGEWDHHLIFSDKYISSFSDEKEAVIQGISSLLPTMLFTDKSRKLAEYYAPPKS